MLIGLFVCWCIRSALLILPCQSDQVLALLADPKSQKPQAPANNNKGAQQSLRRTPAVPENSLTRTFSVLL